MSLLLCRIWSIYYTSDSSPNIFALNPPKSKSDASERAGPAGEPSEEMEPTEGPAPDDDDLLAAAVAAVEAQETNGGSKIKKLFGKRKPPSAAPSVLQIPTPVRTVG